LFQPAEEVAGGAKAMLADGLRERIPKPDVAFSQHVLAHPAGTIGTQVGPVLSAGDSVRITLHGKGSHGSMPHNSVDPVVLAALVVVRLQTIVSRETKPGEFAVLTIGSTLGRDAALSVPTPDHYLPLLYVIAQQREGDKISFPVDGFDGGSVSMLTVKIG